ncbi:hypothetical protein KR009_009905 [Drosophila setifemur]|nr:hypothetical protein KR009_009905 [Drosophila setifemur]
MLLLRLTLVSTLCFCAAQAVLSGKELKRREAGFDTYGPPPRPAPQYGPPPPQQQHVPHREYGVPQQIPFREYGPPSIKYGPPKLNFLSGGGGGGGGGLHEQIKTHFGVPKPFYGPPHIQHKPAPQYGPPPKPAPQYGPPPQPAPQYGPPPKPAPQYGPPPPQYGPPPQPAPQYGPPPPLKIQHRPQPQYGPPKPQYGPPPPSLPLPHPHPAPLFKPAHQPASSYGPPASGPLNLPPKQIYDAPPPNYGPPPLPVSLPGPQQHHQHATTIIVGGGGGHSGPSGPGPIGLGPSGPGPVKQVQIQIDASGHTHSVSGSQAPFHTACDGWKPIPAPIGAYVEQNHIETQGGYSQVAQGHGHGGGGFGTQYSGGIGIGASGSGGGSIIDGLSDEQLVAVALQGGNDGGQVITGPGGNSLDAEALQVTIGSLDDSYSKPPSDSFAPGSVHAQKYQTIGHSGPQGGGNYGPPPPPPGGNYGPPPPPPGGNYGPPPPPPQFAALTSSNSHSHSQSHSNSQSQSNVNIQYGPPPSGNPQPFPQHGAGQPNKPVSYRPPVPAGLLESIGATVQHLDQFGVKPAQQPATYIPPAANEIPLAGTGSGPGNQGLPLPAPQALYQPPPPPPPPQVILQQQLPAPQPGPAFVHQKQFGPPGPPPPPEPQYLPPPPPPVGNVRPLGPPPAFFQQQQQQQFQQQQQQQQFQQQQFQQQQQHHHHQENSYSASQFHSQGLPLPQQAPRFNLQQQQQPQQIIIHDCGHGPNLVSSNGYQVQQQQHQQVQHQQVQQQHQQNFGSVSAALAGAYNAIAQSIPVAEQHTQQLVSDSYGPPPSGNDIDFDHTGYASQKNAVAALPDGTDPQELPGLDGLDVLSAQKSQSIQLNGQQPTQNFQVQFGGSLNNAPGVGAGDANHEEILSQGLLQSILTAIEQPSQQQQSLPQNHKAQSRSDQDHQDEQDQEQQEQEQQEEEEDNKNVPTTEEHEEHSVSSSNRVEVRVLPDDEEETPALVKEIDPIVVGEEEEAKH